MEPVALRIQPPVQFDPFGAAQKGIQLGQMGLQVEQLRQQLRTGAIAEQEAQRALDMRRYEDTARKTLAEIMKRHTTPDASGRNTTDLRAALAEARMAGIDPTFTTELEGKLFSNEAGGLKNEGERVAYIKKYLDELSPQMRFMDEPQAVRFLEQKAPLLARAVSMRSEEIARVVAEHFNLGRPGSSIVKTAQMYSDAQITPEQEREFAARGLSREDISPQGSTSVAMREFLKSRGINVPSNMNVPQMRQDPRLATVIKEYDAQTMGQVPTAEMRREDTVKAAELGASRKLYNDAFAFETELRQLFGTRAGSFTQEAFNNWLSQDPRRALLQSALDNYKKETGVDLDIAKVGVQAAFARLRGHEGKLRQEQETFAKLATTPSISAVAEGKTPARPGEKVPPAEQKARDTDAAAIIRAEYDKEVERLRANPKDAATIANVDSLARELKRQHKITVPGASDVQRGAKAAPAAPAAKETIRVRNKASGKVYNLPKDVAEKELASGKFERV